MIVPLLIAFIHTQHPKILLVSHLHPSLSFSLVLMSSSSLGRGLLRRQKISNAGAAGTRPTLSGRLGVRREFQCIRHQGAVALGKFEFIRRTRVGSERGSLQRGLDRLDWPKEAAAGSRQARKRAVFLRENAHRGPEDRTWRDHRGGQRKVSGQLRVGRARARKGHFCEF